MDRIESRPLIQGEGRSEITVGGAVGGALHSLALGRCIFKFALSERELGRINEGMNGKPPTCVFKVFGSEVRKFYLSSRMCNLRCRGVGIGREENAVAWAKKLRGALIQGSK